MGAVRKVRFGESDLSSLARLISEASTKVRGVVSRPHVSVYVMNEPIRDFIADAFPSPQSLPPLLQMMMHPPEQEGAVAYRFVVDAEGSLENVGSSVFADELRHIEIDVGESSSVSRFGVFSILWV